MLENGRESEKLESISDMDGAASTGDGEQKKERAKKRKMKRGREKE